MRIEKSSRDSRNGLRKRFLRRSHQRGRRKAEEYWVVGQWEAVFGGGVSSQ